MLDRSVLDRPSKATPLSQQIRKLEAEIRVPLFYRTKRRVELTDAGSAFLDEAKAILLHACSSLGTARINPSHFAPILPERGATGKSGS